MTAASAVELRDERIDDEAFVAGLYAETRRAELAPVLWTETQKRDFLRSQFTLQRDYTGSITTVRSSLSSWEAKHRLDAFTCTRAAMKFG